MRTRSWVLAALVMTSTAAHAATQQWGAPGDIPVPRDFDGDGLADYVVFRPSTGVWWVLGSVSGLMTTRQWGQQGDVPVPGDFTGDGRIDFVVWRPSSGTWFILDGVTGVGRAEGWGISGDIPVPGDYDGDGRLELAVWRPATTQWFTRSLVTGGTRVVTFGQPGDTPLPGDYDGVRGDDFAVRSPWGLWQTMGGTTLQLGPTYVLGDVNDIPSTAKFCAATVPRTTFKWGIWMTVGQPSAVLGQPGDVPVPANFAGDWVDEYAVWRPSTGTWFTQASTCDHWTATRDRMARATQRVRGVAVVAVKNNAIVFAEGAGMANQTTPASADIPWQVASISKLFIGTALLTAIDDGLLTLDTPILTNPFFGVSTTVRHHVTHTSSLGSGCYSIGNFHPSSNLLAELWCTFPEFQPFLPGTHAQYSNLGAAWGARLLETTVGVDFNTYTRDNIFTPLGMTSTGWFLTDFAGWQTAIGYANNAPTNDVGVTPYPMGNLRASARDLGKFMIMWLNGGRGAGVNGARILAPNTVALALRPLVPGVSDFGVHWGRSVYEGREWWGHGGVMPGNCTRLNIDPIAKEGVAVLMNGPCPVAGPDLDLIENTVRARLREL